MSKRAAVLVVLDGWGIGPADETNPIFVAEPKNINYIKENFPAGALQSAGISVGLPWNEEGNSEVGHLNLGAGRIIYQYYPRITLAVRDKSFFQNPALKKRLNTPKKQLGGQYNGFNRWRRCSFVFGASGRLIDVCRKRRSFKR